MQKFLVVGVPPNILHPIGVEVYIAGVGPPLRALFSKQGHDFSEKFMHPRRVVGGFDCASAVMIWYDETVGDEPSCGSGHRPGGTVWTGPWCAFSDFFEPSIGLSRGDGARELGEESAVCEVVEHLDPLSCGVNGASATRSK